MKQPSSHTTPAIALISGAYTNELCEAICLWCEEGTLQNIHTILSALHNSNQNSEAFRLVQFMYDTINLSVPEDVVLLCKSPNNLRKYIAELLEDIENII